MLFFGIKRKGQTLNTEEKEDCAFAFPMQQM